MEGVKVKGAGFKGGAAGVKGLLCMFLYKCCPRYPLGCVITGSSNTDKETKDE